MIVGTTQCSTWGVGNSLILWSIAMLITRLAVLLSVWSYGMGAASVLVTANQCAVSSEKTKFTAEFEEGA